jgi:Domain of unknown function (DUF4917)
MDIKEKVNMKSFQAAWEMIEPGERPAILLGNGFSQSWNAKIFNYANLLAMADFGSRNLQIRGLFERLETYDFETVMRALLASQYVLEVYMADPTLISVMKQDQQILKDALVRAISTSHPEAPSEVNDDQYKAVRKFLSSFNNIFTVNYDLLMYWARNKDEIEPVEWETDDGFRAGRRWIGYGTDQKVHFLHGGLHIYDDPSGIKKHVYKSSGTRIIDQVKENLAENKFPLFVSEPNQQKKTRRIENNAYLSYCFRALSEIETSVFIYGHSLDENDQHIFSQLKKCSAKKFFVSIYGDEDSASNLRIKANANAYIGGQHREIIFFDAGTANVWSE